MCSIINLNSQNRPLKYKWFNIDGYSLKIIHGKNSLKYRCNNSIEGIVWGIIIHQHISNNTLLWNKELKRHVVII